MTDDDPEDLTSMRLRQGYGGSAPDEAFRRSLGDRLERELVAASAGATSARRPPRLTAWRSAILIASAASVLIVAGAWALALQRYGPRPSRVGDLALNAEPKPAMPNDNPRRGPALPLWSYDSQEASSNVTPPDFAYHPDALAESRSKRMTPAEDGTRTPSSYSLHLPESDTLQKRYFRPEAPRSGPTAPAGMGLPTVAQQVARSSAIVRGRVKTFGVPTIEFQVDRVVYGQLPAEFPPDKPALIRVEVGYETYMLMARARLEQEKKPVDEEALTAAYRAEYGQVYAPGKPVLFFLGSRRITAEPKEPVFTNPGAAFDVEGFRLDDEEKEVVEVIGGGEHLDPSAWESDRLRDCLRGGAVAVVAVLESVTPEASRWKVERVLRGEHAPEFLRVDYESFHRRAEVIAKARSLKGKPAMPEIDALRREAFDELTRKELTVGRRALLIVSRDRLDPNIEGLPYRLLGATRKEPTEAMEKAITEPKTDPDPL